MKQYQLKSKRLTSKEKKENEQYIFIEKEYRNNDMEIEFIEDRNILKKLRKETDGDLEELSILEQVPQAKKGDHVHLRLTDSEWRKLKLPSTLKGQSRLVNGVTITYGRWNERNDDRAKYLTEEFGFDIYSFVLGLYHERYHTREGSIAVVHSFLYGYDRLYTKRDEQLLKPERNYENMSLLKMFEYFDEIDKKTIAFLTAKLNELLSKKKYKYFSESEVVGLDTELVLLLDKAREIAGIPFIINSGFRTPEHNKKVGGVANSAHLTGKAVDIRATNGKEAYAIIKSAMEVGIKRIGINRKSNFVHLDIEYSKTYPTIYEY